MPQIGARNSVKTQQSCAGAKEPDRKKILRKWRSGLLAFNYPGRGFEHLNGSIEERSIKVALQLLQVIGSGGLSTIFGVVISNPNASSISAWIFSKGTEQAGCKKP